MKKSIFVLIILLLTARIYALPKDFSLGVEPVVSYEFGTLYEYVYILDSTTNTDVKMSELDWPVNAVCIGAKIDAGWKFIKLSLEYNGAIPTSSGTMTDYDWLDYTKGGSRYYYKDSSMCTNISYSENTLNSNNNFAVDLRFQLNPVADFYISPFFKYTYKDFSFSGRNGYGWYGDTEHTHLSYNVPYASSEAASYGKLHGIDYSRQTYSTYLGAGFEYSLKNRFSVSLEGAVSLYTYVESVDFHHSNSKGTTGTYFLDIMNENFAEYYIDFSTEIRVINNLYFDYDFSYSALQQIKGKTYSNSTKKFTPNDIQYSTSRCKYYLFKMDVGGKYYF